MVDKVRVTIGQPGDFPAFRPADHTKGTCGDWMRADIFTDVER